MDSGSAAEIETRNFLIHIPLSTPCFQASLPEYMEAIGYFITTCLQSALGPARQYQERILNRCCANRTEAQHAAASIT